MFLSAHIFLSIFLTDVVGWSLERADIIFQSFCGYYEGQKEERKDDLKNLLEKDETWSSSNSNERLEGSTSELKGFISGQPLRYTLQQQQDDDDSCP